MSRHTYICRCESCRGHRPPALDPDTVDLFEGGAPGVAPYEPPPPPPPPPSLFDELEGTTDE